MDLFLTDTQLFASRHPFTAEDPLVSKWCSATFLQIWWRNKLIYILDGLRLSTFLANVHFWVNYSFLSVWRSHLNKYKSQNVMFWKITQCFKWTLRKYNFGSENSSCSIWDTQIQTLDLMNIIRTFTSVCEMTFLCISFSKGSSQYICSVALRSDCGEQSCLM